MDSLFLYLPATNVRQRCGPPAAGRTYFFPFKPGMAINRCADPSLVPISGHAQLHAWLYTGFTRRKTNPARVYNGHS